MMLYYARMPFIAGNGRIGFGGVGNSSTIGAMNCARVDAVDLDAAAEIEELVPYAAQALRELDAVLHGLDDGSSMYTIVSMR